MFHLKDIKSPILLKGSPQTAFRDPAVVYEKGVFYIYYTYVITEAIDDVYMYVAMSKSVDLVNFTEPKILTTRDKSLNYSSPGNVIRIKGRWAMCLQTYCRENGEKYGNGNSRLWIMYSDDLENWGLPELMKVKGPQLPVEEMGRMIDPYLIEDRTEPGKWWCFFKQNGVSMSFTHDFKTWTYVGSHESGENVCIIEREKEYIMFHSPEDNGIGMMKSTDCIKWEDTGEILTLGQNHWEWAQGRLTAGFVLDCTQEKQLPNYILFFHGTGPENEDIIFDTHASIGWAWSNDLKRWHWCE